MAQQNKHGAQTKGGAMGFVENGSMGCFKSLYECAAQIRKDLEKRHLDFCKDPFPEKTKPSLALEPRRNSGSNRVPGEFWRFF